jgi:glycosyltransferase involved in cell wall biosynthesis|tara:strand:- start:1335 stop:2003 length:669 start_codon:yes stop_codon:yes gene_type:complete
VKNLTLIIPAKHEADCLPKVLEEIKNYNCKIIVVLENSDIETINATKNYNLEIVYQSGKGYGDALIEGINNVKTDYLCIFNADGSFDPKYLQEMLDACENNLNFVFASRYLTNGGSDDDTIITKLGNFIFTKIGNIFFSINISDILYTFLLGKTDSFKKLNLTSKDFCLCVEMPIKAKRKGMNFTDIPSYERKRIAGFKKVNEFSDGFKILFYMIKSFIRVT